MTNIPDALRSRSRGQAMVEFSIAVLVFIVILMGIFDLGRGVYMYNGVSEAAREIARRTSVYPGLTLGASSETQAVIATQRQLVPGLRSPSPGTPDFKCVDIAGNASENDPCQSGDFVKVTVSATYSPISLLGFIGPIDLRSSSSVQIP